MSATERFDNAAENWDTPQRMEIARAVSDAMRRLGLPSPGSKVMDFGAGTGLLSFDLALIAGEVVALDTSEGMVRVMEEKIRSFGVSNVRPLRKDILSGDEADGPYDLIASSMALHHVEDTAKLLKLFYGFLVPGGQIALADLAKEDGSFHLDARDVRHFGFDSAQLASSAEDAGFRNVNCDIFHTVTRRRGDADREYGIILINAKK